MSEEDLAKKVQALLCHKSQWHSTMGIEAGTERELEQLLAVAERQATDAEAAGERRNVRLAEPYKLISPL